MSDRVHRFLCVLMLCLIVGSMLVTPVAAVDPLGWLAKFFTAGDSPRLDTSDWPDLPPIMERVNNTDTIDFIQTRIVNTSLGWVPARGVVWDIFLDGYQENETHTFQYQYRADTSEVTVPLEIKRSYYTADDKLAYTVYLSPQRGPEGNWDALIKCHCKLVDGWQHVEKDIYHNSHISFDSYQQFSVHNMSVIKSTGITNQNRLSFYVTNYGGISVSTSLTYNVSAETVGYRNGVSEPWRPQSAGTVTATLTGSSDTLINITFRSDVDYDSYDYVMIPIKIFKGYNVLCEQDVYYFPPNPTPDTLQLLVSPSAVTQGQDVVFTPQLYNSQSPSYRSDDYIVNIVVNDPLDSQWGSYSATSNVGYTVTMSGDSGQYKARAYCPELDLWSDWVTINLDRVKPNKLDFSVTPTDIKYGKDVTFQHHLYNTGYPSQSYDGYTVAIGLYRQMSTMVWNENVSSNQPLTIPFDVMPPGDYLARAVLFDFVNPSLTIASDEIPIHVGSPDTLEFSVTPLSVKQGQSVTFTNSLYNSEDSEVYDGYTVNVVASTGESSNPWQVDVTSNTPHTVPLNLPPGDYTVQASWVCYPYTQFSVSSSPVDLTVLPPTERVLPTYPVPQTTPVQQIDRGSDSTDWDDWLRHNPPVPPVPTPSLDGSPPANVDGFVHNLVWGLSDWIPTPNGVYLFFRGSGGQVPVNVTNTTMQQLEIEASADDNPLLFILYGCQAIANAESGFMHYITSLMQNNPYYQLSHGISIILTKVVPGFVWNILAVFIIIGSAYPVARYIALGK